MTAKAAHNRGRTQVNAVNAQEGGNYGFINFLKTSQEMDYNGVPTDLNAPRRPIIELDSDGYPTSIVAGTGGTNCVFTIPGSTTYSGIWVITWDGGGTIAIGGIGITYNSGYSSTNLTSTSGGGRVEFTCNTTGTPTAVFQITATNASPNHIHNAKWFRKIDETAMNAGEVFFPDHMALMLSANPGFIRSLGWGGAFNGTNDAMTALWAHRRPRTHITYQGGEYRPGWYGGKTTNSGSDYTLAFGSFSLTDKAVVQLLFNVTAPQNTNTSISWTTTNGSAISLAWPSNGLAVGNTVAVDSNAPSALTAGTTYFIKTNDGTNITLAATSGGTTINATATTSGTCNIISIPRININSTGFKPITGEYFPRPDSVFIGFDVQYPQAWTVNGGVNATMVYDATTGYYNLQNGPFINGGPPELFIDYCAEIGAHPHLVSPYLSMEPLTDYMTSWVTYVRDNGPSWMKPIIEPTNETWNNSSAFKATYYAQAVSYALWGSLADFHNAYGKWCSVLGQAVSSLYGNDRTRYSMICAIQAGSAYNGASVNDPRLKSTLYVSNNGGSPAYLWVDRVCTACYYSPAEMFTTQELVDGYNWTVTYAASPTQQGIIADNYASTAAGSNTAYTIEWGTQVHTYLKAWALGMPGGHTIKGVVAYEGGFSADYIPTGGVWQSVITAVSKAANAVITLGTSSNGQTRASGDTITGVNPAVVGMTITIASVAGMTQLNGNTYTITKVGVADGLLSTQIAINVDSTGFSTYTSGGIITYVNSDVYSNNLRQAGKKATTVGALNTSMYNAFYGLAGTGYLVEAPSNFIYFGTGIWQVLDPDIYQPLTAQWNSIVAFNVPNQYFINLRLRLHA